MPLTLETLANIVPQFYAYEIARNRLGLNDKAHELAKEEAEKERLKAERAKEKGKKRANGNS